MMEDLEKTLVGLLKGEFSSLTISFNEESACNYKTVEKYLKNPHNDLSCVENWVSENEMTLAIKNNSMWTAHWYPDTPNGFYVLHASTLEALIQVLKDFQSE